MTRPATFTCAWCGKSKKLARTGRMPKFCGDYCRRAPESAERQLQGAKWQLDLATRNIAYHQGMLEKYAERSRAAIAPETSDVPGTPARRKRGAVVG